MPEELREWEQCLQMLGDAKVDDHGNVSNTKGGNVMYLDKDSHDREINISAAICFLRGRAYEALENRAQARQWYIAAVKADPLCYEALEHLIENHMLTCDEVRNPLCFRHCNFALKRGGFFVLYLSNKESKYLTLQDKENVVEAKFNDLEKENASSTTSDLSFTGTLKNNTDLLSCKAEYYHQCGEYQKCFELTSLLLEKDPFHLKCTLVHLAAAMELGQSNELYLMACNLVKDYPQKPLSWFAVGCYYYCIRNMTNHGGISAVAVGLESQRTSYAFDFKAYKCSSCSEVTKLLSSTLFVYPLYSKATSLEGTFLSAWIGQGNAYAALEEGDQAMLAYRTAARLFPGCHLPTMYIGMEYMRTHSFKLAEQFFLQAKTICCSDPLVYNELGVVAYHMKE
ncbi:Anaphase-promoting complex subunit 6 [Bienertia sinuspersici]